MGIYTLILCEVKEMVTTKDIVSMLAVGCYFRAILHKCTEMQNVPRFMQSAIDEERLYHIRQSMEYIAICMIERGEY